MIGGLGMDIAALTGGDRLLCRAFDPGLQEISGFREWARHSLGLGISPDLHIDTLKVKARNFH
ncbi:hypothetical protein CUJ84_pRLN1000563 (plasmid) [Rhizobium leguminosarum]|uniref:Uncharacterized protein n=1 Tax=Rhizobium leguminosarum TaxID=384 RepID=A0A2K9ZCP5_RHILE|nr:hypothetical protein CUJ84_pRLN1000563 [Rhizobium leguminosarum]